MTRRHFLSAAIITIPWIARGDFNFMGQVGSLEWYADLYDACAIDDGYKSISNATEIDEAQGFIMRQDYKETYEYVGARCDIPWWMVGAIHMRECNFSFMESIKDGSPLKDGDWTSDAVQILKSEIIIPKKWTLEQALGKCEAYNGLGYQRNHPECLSPYLWSMSNIYQKGKYDRDGHFNPNLIDEQVGIGVLLKSLEKQLKIEREIF